LLLFQKSVACTIVTIASHNFARKISFFKRSFVFSLELLPMRRIPRQLSRWHPAVDAIPFGVHESVNLTLMTFSGRTESLSESPVTTENRRVNAGKNQQRINVRKQRVPVLPF